MVKIIGESSVYNERCYVYEIELPNKNSVYMKIVSASDNNNTYPVIINSEKFLKYWKNVPNGFHEDFALSHGDKKSWQSDYKYHDAEDGFMSGIKDPVPIPRIQYAYYATSNYTRVFNLTRTIWLLANGADSFPVECEGYDNAKNVYNFMGEKEFKLISLAELMN